MDAPPTGTAAMTSPRDPRRYDLDALRAFAMLLGIVLHAALSYMQIPWVVRDGSTAPAFGLVVSAIHGFRMPLFFMLSGFFTAMLWKRRGLGGLLRQRATRIALPLAIGCLTIVPGMWVLVIWAGAGNATDAAADSTRDVWTAAATGDLLALRTHLARGAPVDAFDPVYGMSPLAWAAVTDRRDAVELLLARGADPDARNRDRNAVLHAAAFFGRAEPVALLLEAGADANVANDQGETPIDALRHDRGTTQSVASLLNVSIDYARVVEGRRRARALLEQRGGVSGRAVKSRDTSAGGEAIRGLVRGLVQGLMQFPLFHHLWFLWFLCWLVAGFAVIASIVALIPRVPLPSALVASPLCLLWLVPLTMLTQSRMHAGGLAPGFGPDLSAGLIPIPHVLAHYAIFFGFGALLYGSRGGGDRLGRGWWILLPLALLVLPVALALGFQMPLATDLTADEAQRRLLSSLGQVLYAWLMIFGLAGLFEVVLGRASARVRYVSDSSYWLYLVHLPLIIVGQMVLRETRLPAAVEFVVLVAVVTAVLLVSYELIVRYTWIGRILNGPRARPRAAEEAAPSC